MDKQIRASTQGRHTDRALGQQASTNRSGMEPTLYGQSDAKDTRFVACPGKAEGLTEARRPPAQLAPPGCTVGGNGVQAARSPPTPTQRWNAPDAQTHPAGSAQPQARKGGNGTGLPPPQAGQTEHGTEAGHAEGDGPRETALLAPSSRDWARCARHTNQGRGGGADAVRARAHTHTQRTRGEYQKGNRTEPAERTDRME